MNDGLSLRAVLDEIARRRTALAWRRGWTAGALAAAGALLAVPATLALAAPTGLAFVATVLAGLAVAAAALVLATRGHRDTSTLHQRARLVEERLGGLDDVVVSAVDYASRDDHRPAMAARLEAGALRAMGADAADAVVAPGALGTAARRAVVASAVLALGVALAVSPAWRAARVASLYLVPSRLGLAVEPGHVRVRAGQAVTIRARITGSDALAPTITAGAAPDAVPQAMTAEGQGVFSMTFSDVTASFDYQVDAGARRSDRFTVTVVHPARVESIALDYTYPRALGLPPRHEDDGGDIYAPEGTRVALKITADRPVAASALLLADGTRLPLGVDGAVASGALDVSSDGSYRIAFVDDDGVEMPDDTEYYIRTLLDRPPDVRIVQPAGDRQVTPLEEVVIDARADDDFGVQSFDLLLQKPGAPEVTVPLARGAAGLTVNGSHTLYLEGLEVEPGDIVSYYVRARDIGRGKPSSETRSDIYFLEVKAFNDEFVAAQSQAMSAGGQAQGVQDLAAAQKELVVATWKIDSRGRRARAAGSAADITALADAQRALEQRAAKEAGNQMQAAGATPPRRRRPGAATLNTVGDDPLGLAIEAMRRAVIELERRDTAKALPHEMEALNQLLRADSDVQRRQIARQQGGSGGGNRNTPDLSALFDQELRKQQETNYETPASSETRQDAGDEDDPLAKLRELARRQEALSREQQDLARTQAAMDAEEIKRRLERLTRDQEDVRRRLEQVARELAEQQARQDGDRERRRDGQSGAQGARQAGASPGQSQGTSPGAAQTGAAGGSGSGGGRPDERQAMREALDEMRQASSELREQDAAAAGARAGRALERLRQAEDALQGSTASDLRRRLGDLQLEARQLAEAQRRLAGELAREGGAGATGDDRRQAGEQSRLAERADRLQRRMGQLSEQAPGGAGRTALGEAAREMAAGRVSSLMRESAAALDREGGRGGPPSGPPAGQAPTRGGAEAGESARRAAQLGADAARALDRVAERLDGRPAADGTPSARLSDDLARARDLRERLEDVDRSLEALRAEGERGAAQARQGQGAPASEAPGGRERGGSEIDRLQRQLADDMRAARAEVDALGRSANGLRGPSTPEQWQPSVSAPGTEAFKQDFARWETLKRNLLLALERIERGLADDLRAQATRDRLHAGASEAVPEDYRRLVDKYYRSLASPRRPER